MNLSSSLGFLFLFISMAGSLQVITDKPPPFAFSFDFSTRKPPLQQISLLGGAKLARSSVRLSAPSAAVIYKKPLHFLGNNLASGLTTHFSFSTIPANVVNFGELDFFLLPYNNESENGDSLFELNGVLPPNTVSVKLLSNNKTDNFIKIHVGADLIAQSSGLSGPYLSEQLHCSIHYNGVSKRMVVRVGESKESKFTSALLSYPVDLSGLLLKDRFVVGLRYSGMNSTQSASLNSWSFSTNQGGQIHSIHSEPLDPRSFVVPSTEDHPANHKQWGFLVVMVFAAACAVLLVWYTIVSTWKSVSSESGMYSTQAGYRKFLMLEGENANGCLELEDLE